MYVIMFAVFAMIVGDFDKLQGNYSFIWLWGPLGDGGGGGHVGLNLIPKLSASFANNSISHHSNLSYLSN